MAHHATLALGAATMALGNLRARAWRLAWWLALGRGGAAPARGGRTRVRADARSAPRRARGAEASSETNLGEPERRRRRAGARRPRPARGRAGRARPTAAAVITGAAHQRSQRIAKRGLPGDAFVPEDGQSLDGHLRPRVRCAQAHWPSQLPPAQPYLSQPLFSMEQARSAVGRRTRPRAHAGRR